jgi:hypothetical protein
MNDYRTMARLIGVGLTCVGLFSVGATVYWVVRSQGQVLDLSAGVLAVIPGVALLMGSRRALHVIAFLAAVLLGWLAVCLAAAACTVPVALVLPALRSFPAEIAKGVLWLIVALAFAVLVCRTSLLSGEPATAGIKPTFDRGSRRRLFWAVAVGAALAVLPASCIVSLQRGSAAERARAEAARTTGPGYRYFVYHLSVHYRTAGSRTSAKVIAFNSREARSLEVTWQK